MIFTSQLYANQPRLPVVCAATPTSLLMLAVSWRQQLPGYEINVETGYRWRQPDRQSAGCLRNLGGYENTSRGLWSEGTLTILTPSALF
jgi:hypothetical protein